MSRRTRPHPNVAIPPPLPPRAPPSPTPSYQWSPGSYDDHAADALDLSAGSTSWQDHNGNLSPHTPPTAGSLRNGASLNRPASFSATSYHDPASASWQFPEPQIQRSLSHQSSPGHRPPINRHRYAKSDAGTTVSESADRQHPSSSVQATPEESREDLAGLSHELSSMTLQSEEGLRRFQSGELAPADEEWHRLVPETAKEALGPKEVQRQSVLFEVFKSEREYVADLEACREVFVGGLSSSAALPQDQIQDFIKEVFWNINEVLSYHQQMLGSLFSRQRDQHPLVQSVNDIILETLLNFRPAYESYIKHYPISEARHRSELKNNTRYQKFVTRCMQDERIRKRDLVTFLSRPVTRLPRLILVLEHIQKLTDPDHPDVETMPLILTILSDFIKSTQPGIESAESKVKLLSLADSLWYKKGEIIDMDLYDESRQLIHKGPLSRRQRSEVDWHGWNDYVVTLLDNFFLVTRADTRNGNTKHVVAFRPIPLEFMQLGQFDAPSENRRERAEDGGLLESFRSQHIPMHPFTVYHAASKSTRRYTFYATSEAVRKKWHDALVEAIALRKVRQEANQWFVPNTVSDGFFRTWSSMVPVGATAVTGKVTSATPFTSAGKNYLAVGCGAGIYVALRGTSAFRKVLRTANPTAMVALQDHNKLIVHVDALLLAFSLDILARVSQGQSTPQALDASLETIAGQEGGAVIFFRAGEIAKRMVVAYGTKSFRTTTVFALELVSNSAALRRGNGGSLSFRSFGNPFYVPRPAQDMTFMARTIAISSEHSVIIIDPTNLSSSSALTIPAFGAVPAQPSGNDRFTALRSKCDDGKTLGLARCDHDEIMVVYDEFGCYVTRHGVPCRQFNFIRWETKATAFVHRGGNILLFSSEFIEIRSVATGRLVQVIEGRDTRLLHSGPPPGAPLLVAMRGQREDNGGVSDSVVELVETAEITTASTPGLQTGEDGLWDEWDM